MNKFKKYCPNVWIAECDEKHEKGDIIQLETKYGKEVDCKVYNLILSKESIHFYSIVRIEDKTYAERKVEKYNNAANNSLNKSNASYEAAQESREFLSLGEPIKIGHHSENRHRNLIKRNAARMDKCIEHLSKAEEQKQKVKYWESKINDINLSMPESLEFYEYELEKVTKHHKGLKDGTIKKEHSYSVTYANKKVKETTKKLEISKLLWS